MNSTISVLGKRVSAVDIGITGDLGTVGSGSLGYAESRGGGMDAGRTTPSNLHNSSSIPGEHYPPPLAALTSREFSFECIGTGPAVNLNFLFNCLINQLKFFFFSFFSIN